MSSFKIELFQSWRDFPMDRWRWPNFSPGELACRGTGKLLIHEPSLDMLQSLRDLLRVPLIVTSAYRTPEYNKTLRGAAKNSQHLTARAFDISMLNHDPAQFIAAAERVGFTGIGTYPGNNFVHVDTGPRRRWGKPFPSRPVTLSAEIEQLEDTVPADRFAPEPAKPTIIEALAKPEVLLPALAPAGAGALKLAEQSWILQSAIAAGFVLLVAGGIVWIVRRQRGGMEDD